MSVTLLWVGSFGKVLEPQWLKAVSFPWLLGEKQTALFGVRTLGFFSKLRMPQSSTSPREGALFLYPLLTGSGSDTGLGFLSCQGSLGRHKCHQWVKAVVSFPCCAVKVSGVILNICTRWHKAPLLWSDWQAPIVIKVLAWPERRQTIFFLDLHYSSAGMLTYLMVPANWKVFKIKKI